MPEQYNKLAEGIVKGNVPMVASFVERYVSDDEPGFFVGDREHVEGDIRVHVTIFGYLEQSDTIQLGVVDLQQLPDGRVWMVVGALPTITDGEAWLNDVYSAMVRRMAARLVQFGFLDAPNRPRLRAPSTFALTQVAQALKPPRTAAAPPPEPAPEPIKRPEPAPRAAPPPPQAEPAAQREREAVAPAAPASYAAPVAPAAPSYAGPTPATLASQPPPRSPIASVFGVTTSPQLDVVLTIAMVAIWAVACGMLFYLLTLLLK
jgi:hypothetical protein